MRELLEREFSILVLITILKGFHQLFLSRYLGQDFLQILKSHKSLLFLVKEEVYFLEARDTGLGKHSLLVFLLLQVGLDFLVQVETRAVLLAPDLNHFHMLSGEIRVQLEDKLFESNFSVLLLVKEVVKTSGHTFHVIVFFLVERLEKILNQDCFLSIGDLIKIVSQVEHLLLSYRSSFLKLH